MTTKPKGGGGVLAGLIVMAITFVLIELASMLAFSVFHLPRSRRAPAEYPYHPYLGWENLPNHLYKGTLAGGRHSWSIRTDSTGLAITPSQSHADPEVRVAVVGGSAMFGVGQSENAFTAASHLEEELSRRTGARIEVYNLAVGGYTSFQEALNLERFLSTHRADVVVSLSGYNDAFAAAIEEGPDFGLLLHRVDPKARLVRAIERGGMPLFATTFQVVLAELRLRSRAVDLLGLASEGMRPPAPPVPWVTPAPDSAEIARRARFVLTNYAMMDAMTRQNGGRFVMCLQPTAMNRARLTASEQQSIEALNPEFMARARPSMRVFYPTLLATPHTFDLYDLTSVFDDFEEPAFADECHYLDGATPVLASAIADVIAPSVTEAALRNRARRPASP